MEGIPVRLIVGGIGGWLFGQLGTRSAQGLSTPGSRPSSVL